MSRSHPDRLTPEECRMALLALEIADSSVRSDIELFAAPRDIEGVLFYDIECPAYGTDPVDALARVSKAVEYIRARGDVFDWRLLRHVSSNTLVSFQEKV